MLIKVITILGRLPGRLWHRARQAELRTYCIADKTAVLHPTSIIDNFSKAAAQVSIGAGTHLLGQLIVFPHGGRISIGNDCYIGEHSRLWSMSAISVGNRVQISHGVNIHDNSAHSMSAQERHIHLKAILTTGHPKSLLNVATSPITICDDAWIGFNATILRGVTVGVGAIVGAGSVVTKSVPSYAIVAGNPAQMIGTANP